MDFNPDEIKDDVALNVLQGISNVYQHAEAVSKTANRRTSTDHAGNLETAKQTLRKDMAELCQNPLLQGREVGHGFDGKVVVAFRNMAIAIEKAMQLPEDAVDQRRELVADKVRAVIYALAPEREAMDKREAAREADKGKGKESELETVLRKSARLSLKPRKNYREHAEGEDPGEFDSEEDEDANDNAMDMETNGEGSANES